ncbi:putative DNA binding protein [Corchorus olitorius]|uniref:DNA binding protein n=1 Tax=Corchorus olitorius TaxID=93759 RepID=A0A1R3KIA8_9ROSI|nr:putative DNA binding protein [Corchorus olitorius]
MPEPRKQTMNLHKSFKKPKKIQPQPTMSEEETLMTRKVRVIFHDPYATDSSSSEDESETPVSRKSQKGKRVIREIRVPAPDLPPLPKPLESESSSQDSNSKTPASRKRDLKSESVLSHTSPSSVLELDTSASVSVSNSNDNDYFEEDANKEGFDANFANLPIPDFCFIDDPLLSGSVGQELNLDAEPADYLLVNDFGLMLEDYCSIEDLSICGIEGDEPSELPDCDFGTDFGNDFGTGDFLFGEEVAPLNIACP